MLAIEKQKYRERTWRRDCDNEKFHLGVGFGRQTGRVKRVEKELQMKEIVLL